MEVEQWISIFSKNNCTFRLDASVFFVVNINHIENYANVKSHAFLRTQSERSY